jgi:hypothetical protein
MMDDAAAHTPKTDPITAAELARVLRRLAKLFDTGELGNIDTSDALVALADYLQSLGSVAVTDLTPAPRKRKQPRAFDDETVRNSSIGEVRDLLAGELPKSLLVRLARIRFGMPESRLQRLPMEQVLEAVRAAAAHEESLDIIERNADASGRARSS